MGFEDYFPVWDKLTPEQKNRLKGSAVKRTAKKGTVVHGGGRGCTGLLVVGHGQLRAYIISGEGREVTLYRLLDLLHDALHSI